MSCALDRDSVNREMNFVRSDMEASRFEVHILWISASTTANPDCKSMRICNLLPMSWISGRMGPPVQAEIPIRIFTNRKKQLKSYSHTSKNKKRYEYTVSKEKKLDLRQVPNTLMDHRREEL